MRGRSARNRPCVLPEARRRGGWPHSDPSGRARAPLPAGAVPMITPHLPLARHAKGPAARIAGVSSGLRSHVTPCGAFPSGPHFGRRQWRLRDSVARVPGLRRTRGHPRSRRWDRRVVAPAEATAATRPARGALPARRTIGGDLLSATAQLAREARGGQRLRGLLYHMTSEPWACPADRAENGGRNPSGPAVGGQAPGDRALPSAPVVALIGAPLPCLRKARHARAPALCRP